MGGGPLAKHKPEDVVKYLKTEIVISGHNEDVLGGLLDKELIAKIRNKLGDGVVQILVQSCTGADIADQFVSSNQCSSYLSVTDHNTNQGVGGNHPSAFSAMLPDKGDGIRSQKVKSTGFRNWLRPMRSY